MYLLYNNEADALARSEQAGIDKGLAYHKGDRDYRNLLTGVETSALLEELPDDWIQTTDD